MSNDKPDNPYVTPRELYQLLDKDMRPRLRRVEIGLAVVLVMSGSQLASLFGGPSANEVVAQAVRLIV